MKRLPRTYKDISKQAKKLEAAAAEPVAPDLCYAISTSRANPLLLPDNRNGHFSAVSVAQSLSHPTTTTSPPSQGGILKLADDGAAGDHQVKVAFLLERVKNALLSQNAKADLLLLERKAADLLLELIVSNQTQCPSPQQHSMIHFKEAQQQKSSIHMMDALSPSNSHHQHHQNQTSNKQSIVAEFTLQRHMMEWARLDQTDLAKILGLKMTAVGAAPSNHHLINPFGL
jgi:hypothetical protein